MRLVHLADLHLGFRQFDRNTPEGVNIRENDVAQTFHTAITDVIALEPEVIVVAGDLFHVVRPGNGTIITANREFQRLVTALPGTIIVFVAGNHDTPAMFESKTLLDLFAPLGIHVVTREPRTLEFRDRDLTIFAVPDAGKGMPRPIFDPGTAKYRVCVMHGEVRGVTQNGAGGRHTEHEVTPDDMLAPDWSYVAMGHYHCHELVRPNIAYSGSIDLTSTDPWGEVRTERERGIPGKGFVERNLDTGEHTFHPLERSREHVDMTLSADGMTSEQLNEALQAAFDEEWIDEAVVRMVVTECPKDVSHSIDQKMLRQYKARALNLALTFRRPEVVRVGIRVGGGLQRAKPLEEMLADFVAARVAADDFGGFSLEDATMAMQGYLTKATDLVNNTGSLVPALEASIAATAPVAEEVAA